MSKEIDTFRGQKVVIDAPKVDDEIWISVIIQQVIVDEHNKVLSTHDRVNQIYRNTEQFSTQLMEITDPVTGIQHQLSGAGLALLVRSFVRSWMITDMNLISNPETNNLEKIDNVD